MSQRTLHFHPTLDVMKLCIAAGEHFACSPAAVFVYFDAVDIWGSGERDPDPVQKAAFEAASVRMLIRRFPPGAGPLEGWLRADLKSGGEVDDGALARTLATATGVNFYYVDPVPDPEDEPGAEAAQIEITPQGAARKVWLIELSDVNGTETVVSGRGEDEDADH